LKDIYIFKDISLIFQYSIIFQSLLKDSFRLQGFLKILYKQFIIFKGVKYYIIKSSQQAIYNF